MADREAVLDALMVGDPIGVVADRFDLTKAEVRKILREESERTFDGAAMRDEWALTARRLRRMELKFDKYAIDNLDCTAAIVAIKASERRASLSGAGSAAPSHLITVMQAKAIEEAPTSTEHLRRVLDELMNKNPARLEPPPEPSDP
jgi:rhamnose utilization protein RhaD (predicted bifunctional aldolase and dehydrogenase)